ncbi:MAG: CpaF family protein [Acidimicrobiia bacterium]
MNEEHRWLVRELRERVALELSNAPGGDGQGGRHLAPADKRQLARKLIEEGLRADAAGRLKRGEHPLDDATWDSIAQAVYDALFGLGPLQPLLEDQTITDIHVNGCETVFVRRRADGTTERVGPVADSDDELIELVRRAASRQGRTERRFDEGAPNLDLQLPDGSRLHALMEVTHRPSVTIRLHHFRDATLGELQGMGMSTDAVSAFSKALVLARMNTLVTGGQAVGKTTYMRALIHEVPAEERLVVIEDSLELGIERMPHRHPNVVSIEARQPNIEGKGGISLADEVRWSLRMDADRVVVGEVRSHEVLPMLNVMSSGKRGSMCTLHADSSSGVFERLAMLCVQTPERLDHEATALLVANAIDFVIFIHRVGGHRCVASIREVTGADGRIVATNEVFSPDETGMATPTGRGRISDWRLGALADVGFEPSWLDARRPMEVSR